MTCQAGPGYFPEATDFRRAAVLDPLPEALRVFSPGLTGADSARGGSFEGFAGGEPKTGSMAIACWSTLRKSSRITT
jgi:hypothetical protein